MIFPKLAGDIAQIPQQTADRRVFLTHPHWRARKADLGEAGADDVLAGEKRGAASRTRLLAVVMQKTNAFADVPFLP